MNRLMSVAVLLTAICASQATAGCGLLGRLASRRGEQLPQVSYGSPVTTVYYASPPTVYYASPARVVYYTTPPVVYAPPRVQCGPNGCVIVR